MACDLVRHSTCAIYAKFCGHISQRKDNMIKGKVVFVKYQEVIKGQVTLTAFVNLVLGGV